MSASPAHRVRRFFSSLVARAPSAADTEWAHSLLGEHEERAFDRMAPKDRAHAIAVARAVQHHLDTAEAETGVDPAAGDRRGWMLAAALTHDVGKSVVRLGTYGRVMATLSGAVAGTSMAPLWAEKRGMVRRIGLYLQYPRFGADILELAGSDPRVVAWAAQHHLPEEDWTVPLEDGRLLVAADDGDLPRPSRS